MLSIIRIAGVHINAFGYGPHLGDSGVHVGHVDCAGVEIDEGHGNPLPLKSGKMVEVHRTHGAESHWPAPKDRDHREQTNAMSSGSNAVIRCRHCIKARKRKAGVLRAR